MGSSSQACGRSAGRVKSARVKAGAENEAGGLPTRMASASSAAARRCASGGSRAWSSSSRVSAAGTSVRATLPASACCCTSARFFSSAAMMPLKTSICSRSEGDGLDHCVAGDRQLGRRELVALGFRHCPLVFHLPVKRAEHVPIEADIGPDGIEIDGSVPVGPRPAHDEGGTH